MTGRPLVTTAKHPRVRAARRLAKRAARRSEQRFLVEGPTVIAEALAEPGLLLELFVTPEAAARHGELVDRAVAAELPVHEVDSTVLAELAQTVTPPGIVGIARCTDVPLDKVLAGARLVVVLEQARDPGNAGTILRAADALGADGAVLTDSSVDAFNPKCARAAAGSLFRLPFAVDVAVAETVTAARTAGLQVLAATAVGELSLADADLARPTAWLFGNEAWGLTDPVLTLADASVRIPLRGAAESLNVATAAAICLYASAEALRTGG